MIKKLRLFCLFVFLTGIFFIPYSNAHAEDFWRNVIVNSAVTSSSSPLLGPILAPMAGVATATMSAPKVVTNTIKDVGVKIVNLFVYLLSFSLYLVSLLVGFLIDLSGKTIDFFFSADKLASSEIVKSGWTFTRDTLNFVFILVLLAISFSTIAGIETFQMRKALPSVIFAALLVNFSLAIAGAFLQVSKVMTQSIADSVLPANADPNSKDGVGKRLITGLMKSGEITTFYTYNDSSFLAILLPADNPKTSFAAAMNTEEGKWTQFLLEIMKSALFLIVLCVFCGAFIFLAAILVIRLVMLIILLILAPVPFVFSVIPQTKTYANQWWSEFIKYTFLTPVMTFFLALAIRILQTKNDKMPLASQFFTKQTATTEVVGSIFDAVFVSIFIIVSVLVAKKLGVLGANAVMGAAKKTTLGAVRIGAFPAIAGGKMAANATGKGALMATDAVGNKIAKTPYLGAGLRGARQTGRVAQRLYKGQEANAQLEEKKKALAGMSKEELQDAYKRGNVAAGVKLMENDDLDREQYAGLSAKVPKGTEAYDKVKSNWKKKDPIGAVLGSDLHAKLNSTTPLTQADQKRVDDAKNDVVKAFGKMNKEDYSKLSANDIKMARKMGLEPQQIMNKSQLDAVADSSNIELQDEASALVKALNAPGNAAKLKPGQRALIERAKKLQFGDNQNTPPSQAQPLLPGSGSIIV